MLIRAPWFIYRLPPVNDRYNDDVIDPCFEAVTYTVGDRSIKANIDYTAAYNGIMPRYVTKAHLSGFGKDEEVVELTLVTNEAGLYCELPINPTQVTPASATPPAMGMPAWLLMTAYRDDLGWHYWGSNDKPPNVLVETCAPLLVEVCQQLAAKLMPQRAV